LLQRWINVAIQQARLTWIINGNSAFAPIIPLLLGAPKFLAGTLTLGELMQLASAFLQVQVALNWLVYNSIRLAEWNASARRRGARFRAELLRRTHRRRARHDNRAWR
jgi:putative ATP-binding cassette transporter